MVLDLNSDTIPKILIFGKTAFMKKIILFFLVFTAFTTNAQQKDRNGKPIDFAQASTDHLTKVLNLDGFQSAAIKTFMNDYKKEVESLSQIEMPDEARAEKYNIANQKLEGKIIGMLNAAQKILYENEKNKKDKKRKKDKGKKESETETDPKSEN